jgi:hypothetical protein
MLPLGCRAYVYGMSCRIDIAVTDYPDPLSPTSPTVSPRSMSKVTWRTEATSPTGESPRPSGVSNETDR